MRAIVGDRIHFRSKAVGVPEHTGLVIEIRGENGAPPYVVRQDNGHESVVYPGVDVWIEHTEEAPSS